MVRPRDDRQKELLRPALRRSSILATHWCDYRAKSDWVFLDRRFAGICTPGAGQPGLPTRLVAGLFILKHQFLCGGLSFCHRPLFGRIGASGWARSRWWRSPGEPIGGA